MPNEYVTEPYVFRARIFKIDREGLDRVKKMGMNKGTYIARAIHYALVRDGLVEAEHDDQYGGL